MTIDDETAHPFLSKIAPTLRQKQTLLDLQESNLRILSPFYASPIPMAIFSFPDGKIININDSFSAFVGYSRQETIGFTDLDLRLWQNLNDRKLVIEKIKQESRIKNVEVVARSKHKGLRVTLFSAEYIILSHKPYLLVWCVDITELKQAEQASEQLNREYKSLAENSPDIISRVDKNLRHIYINPIVETVTGIPATDWIGKTVEELGFDEEFCSLWRQHFKHVFTSGKKVLFEHYFTNTKGKLYNYQAHLAPEYAADGSVKYVLCIIRDITNLKEIEQALRASEERKQRLLDVFPDLLFRLNRSGQYLDYQTAKDSLLYKQPASFLNKTIHEVLPTEVADKIMRYVNCTFATGEKQLFEYQLPINGNILDFEARIVLANTNEVLYIVRDITELKQLQNEVTRLDRLNLVGEMAAGIAHELRNPMTTVRGFLQVLCNKPECSKYANYFDLMIEELDRSNLIISEFLSLAKNKKVQLEPDSLPSIIKSLAPLIQADATLAGKKIELVLEDTPELLVDAKEIRQLILNLSRNAIEASPPQATVTIKTYQAAKQVILAIQDQGPGIPAEIIEKLGTPFFTTKDHGTGLGLAICYSIAARHNATISVDSTPSGTTFFVRFSRTDQN